MLAAVAALLFLIGYSSQRSGVCMVRAVQEVVVRQRLHRLAGLTLAAGWAMLVMGLAELAGARPFETILGARPDGLALAGGFVFALGTLLAGHCALGMLAALTAGDLPRSAGIAAMFAAAVLLGPSMSGAVLMLPQRAAVPSPLAGHVLAAIAIGAIMIALAAAYIHRRIGWRQPRGGWSPLVAMSLIGAASGLLFALDREWLYTSRIAQFAHGTPGTWAGLLAGPLVLMAGMTIAARRGGMFRLRAGTMRDWARSAAGGLLMGAGATLVPGGNDTMLFTGVPLLLPNLLAAYAVFTATLAAALLVRRGAGGGR